MILRRTVDSLHASASNTDVIRAIRHTLSYADRDPALRAWRKALYRYALAIHRSNIVAYVTRMHP